MLIGRGSEEARIRGIVTDVRSCIVVHGEAGVGKSALVRAALADAETREGGALSTLSWLPFLPLRRAFTDLPDAVWTGDAEHVASRIEAVAGDDVVLVEDLHWADPATLQALGLLAGRVRLVLTVRRGDPGAETALAALADVDAPRIDLDPLEDADAAALALRLRPGMSPDEVDSIVDRSGGNPLLVEELTRSPGDVTSLELSLLARCRALPEEQLDGLALLSLAGRPLPEAHVPVAHELAESGLTVTRDDEVSIRHALIGEVFGQLISQDRAVRCHRLLVNLAQHPGERAQHLLAAGDRAAAHAAAMEAVDSASTPGERWPLLVTAAEAADPESATELRVAAAEAAVRGLQLDAAERLVSDLPDDLELRARSLAVRTSIAFQQGRWVDYRELLAEATAVAPDGSPIQTRLMVTNASKVLLMDRDSQQAHELALLAMETARARGHSTGEATKMAGDSAPTMAEKVRLLRDAVQVARDSGNSFLEVTSALNLFISLLSDAQVAASRELVREMVERCRELRLTRWELCFDTCELTAAAYCADLRHVVTEGARLLAEPLRPIDRFDTLATVGSAHAQLGELEQALACTAELDGHDSHVMAYHQVRGTAYLLAGQAERAHDEHAPFMAMNPDGFMVTDAAHIWAWAAFDAGLPLPERPPLADAGLLDGVSAELSGISALESGELAEAHDLFLEAATAHGPRLDRAMLCRWGAGEAARLAGREEARTLLEEVAEQARDLGLAPVAVRCARSLRALGVRVPTSRASGSVLSAREEEVTVLAATGHTDAEIAARLGIAHRTVQTHIANARRKLGASSRAQLVAMLAAESA
ncbi:MAG: LuxR C-terminal-related transcriptional regulator [Nocardioides sp.]|nr:LuxR C-terminal-related transcriptional regulator [Nocardioides sp.]